MTYCSHLGYASSFSILSAAPGYHLPVCSPSASHAWASCAPNMNMIFELSSRVGSLEAQVEKMRTEKIDAEMAVQSSLREGIDMAARNASACSAIRRLRTRLAHTKQENHVLKLRMRLTNHLFADISLRTRRTIKSDLESPGPVINASYKKVSEPADLQVTDNLLIDFSTSDESTDSEFPKDNVDLSVGLDKKTEHDEGLHNSGDDTPGYQKLTSYDTADLTCDSYVYRFGHGNTCGGPTVNTEANPKLRDQVVPDLQVRTIRIESYY